jgi:hypothetical protein
MATPVVNYPELDPDLGSILHEEIDRLPEVERLPVVLCDLESLDRARTWLPVGQRSEAYRWLIPGAA